MERQYNDHELVRSPVTKKTSNVAKIPIEQLGLCAAARTALQSTRLVFATDLAEKTESELKVLGLSSRDIRNVADRLSLHGLALTVTQSHICPPALSSGVTTLPISFFSTADLQEAKVVVAEDNTHTVRAESISDDLSVDHIFITAPKPPKPDARSMTDDERAMRQSELVKARGSSVDTSLIERLRHKATMTVEEAAQLYGCSRNTAYRECKLGKIPTLHQGRSIRVITALVFAELHL